MRSVAIFLMLMGVSIAAYGTLHYIDNQSKKAEVAAADPIQSAIRKAELDKYNEQIAKQRAQSLQMAGVGVALVIGGGALFGFTRRRPSI